MVNEEKEQQGIAGAGANGISQKYDKPSAKPRATQAWNLSKERVPSRPATRRTLPVPPGATARGERAGSKHTLPGVCMGGREGGGVDSQGVLAGPFSSPSSSF